MRQSILIGIVLFLTMSHCSDSYTPLIIGHRGARGHVAENTLPSIQKALNLGVDGIEIDIFRCFTGELVVFHDQTLDTLTNSKGLIENLSLDSLRKVSVLGGYQIPTLEEVLQLVNGEVMLNIELKGNQTALLTHELITHYFDREGSQWKPNRIFISSFDWDELKLFYEVNKEVPIAILTEDDPLDAIPIGLQLSAFAINPDFETLTPEVVKKIHQSGFEIYPWTVNTSEDIERMKTLRVEGIITDFPERINQTLKP